MRIENELKLDFKDVLIRPKRSTLVSRSEVDLTRQFTFKHSKRTFNGVPIIAANMDGVGTFSMASELATHRMFTCLTKHYPKYELKTWIDDVGKDIRDNWAYSIGISDLDMSKFDAVISNFDSEDFNILNYLRYVCIDVANGYTEAFARFVEEFRKKYPMLTIIAGNVVTGEMTEELILRGADLVKVGVGPGGQCTTRITAGVGYPQLSAIIECADAAHGLGGHIIADGGCSTSGDIAKAFGAGADFVMLGSMLAGHDESESEIVNGKVIFYGMSSETAMEKHYGHKANYRASEGRTVALDYKGPVKETVLDLLGGVRSACSYVGATKLKELSKRTTFVRVNSTHNTTYISQEIKK